MPTPFLILQIVTLLAVIFLLFRRQPAPAQDPRLTQIPDQLTRLDARNQALDDHVRTSFAQMRTDIAAEAERTRTASAAAALAGPCHARSGARSGPRDGFGPGVVLVDPPRRRTTGSAQPADVRRRQPNPRARGLCVA